MNFKQLKYTSDNVRRDITVTEGDILKGFTWNLRHRCVSKEYSPYGFSNNPFNYTETKTNISHEKKVKL